MRVELTPLSSTSATLTHMTTVGLRELRQNASELVRRVEAGEEVTITVSGRASARLMPATQAHWHAWNDIAELFNGAGDDAWEADRDLVAHEVRDPWEQRG